MTITPKYIKEEQARMELERKDYEKLKELSVALSYPGRSDKMDYYSLFDDKGKSNTTIRQVYDATAFRGLDIWANGILGNYMPSNFAWFNEQMADMTLKDSRATRKWLQETDEHMRSVLSTNDFYQQMPVLIKDAGAIGDAYMFIEQDEGGKQMTMCPHPREFWLKRDYWGRVVGLHHKTAMTLEQVVGEFGEKAIDAQQKLQFKTAPNTKIEIIHCVYKNKDYNPNGLGNKNMLWQHYYLNASSKDGAELDGKIIRQTGTHTLNPIPWSLNRPSNETYGRGIVSQMLIEILTCNFMSRDLLMASQQAVSPASIVSSALKSKLDRSPGSTNFFNHNDLRGMKAGDLVARLVDSSGYPFGKGNQVSWQNLVSDRFGVNIMLALNMDNSPTLGQSQMKQAERVTLMAPFIGSLSSMTDMILDRSYSIECAPGWAAGGTRWLGRAPQPPQEVVDATNGRIDIQYIGPLVQLLKRYYDTNNLINAIEYIKAVASIKPESLDIINGDAMMKKILTSNNTPEEIMLSEQEVMELRAIAAQQQEAIQGAQLAATASKAIPNMSGKIENDSILKSLMQAA